MRVADLVKQRDARIKLCEILNALYTASFTTTVDFSSTSAIATAFNNAGMTIRFDSSTNRFKARG